MLHALLSSHSELIPDARRAANALLASVSFAAVAKSIVDALMKLGLDDLDAGPHAGGYVEPSEAAWETIGQAVAPYLRDLERRVKLQHEDEATELARESFSGSIAPSNAGSSFSSMPTSALPTAGHAVDKWRGRRQQTLPRAFVQKFTPDWDWLLQ